jgi:hypothetical protein
MANYNGLDFDRAELSAAMREGYDRLIDFITSAPFAELHQELMQLSPQARPAFVENVLLQSGELNKRGIYVPPNILIQTSAFGDRRPTLFAVKTWLPEKFHRAWENVNWTFDNEFADDQVSRSLEVAWREPLSVSLQNSLISKGIDLEFEHRL